SVQRSGGMLVGGSDWDVSSLDPLEAIETLIRRQDPLTSDGDTLGNNEEIDLDTALRAYTINAAHVMSLDEITGSITIGKRADLIVLDQDLYTLPASAINDARVLLTLVDGEEVYRHPEL
ncbi:MAG: amidohydrolase family protein, partial [Woeseia sp.]